MNRKEQVKELTAKLNALIAERTEITRKLEEDVPKWQARLRELRGEWRSLGEIEGTRLAIRDAGFPVWEKSNGYGEDEIIVAVDEKWITIRKRLADPACKYNGEKQYSVTTGRKKAARDDYRAIDAAKAQAMWAEFKKENP